MGYVKAEEVLPEKVLLLVQEYIDGNVLYIPRKGSKKGWGTESGMKRELAGRNQQICAEYRRGSSVGELAVKHCLTEKSIRRIIREYK